MQAAQARIDETEQIRYGYPGEGAIQYASKFTEGLSRGEAAHAIHRLLKDEIHDTTDKRIKRCAFCGYYWRDDSLRNTKKTCCDACHTGKKSLQRRKQRERKELMNPKQSQPKRTLADDYVYWLEYPYWTSEKSMLSVGWRYEVPRTEKLRDFIEAKNQIYGKGNRAKQREGKQKGF